MRCSFYPYRVICSSWVQNENNEHNEYIITINVNIKNRNIIKVVNANFRNMNGMSINLFLNDGVRG